VSTLSASGFTRSYLARFGFYSRLAGLFIAAVMFVNSVPAVLAQQSPSEPLILRMGDVSANKFPFILAVDAGIYTKNGINVIPKFSPGSVATIRRSGINIADENIYDEDSSEAYTIAISGSSPMIVGFTTLVTDRQPIVLGSTHSESRWRIFTGPNITSVEQLKGKRIGYSSIGAVSHNYALQFVKHMGWDPQFDVSLMGNALAVEALLNGQIDALIGPELIGTMALMNDFNVLTDLSSYHFPVAGSALVADREWYLNNPLAARAFIKSAVEAIAMMKTDKQFSFQVMEKWYGMKDNEAKELFYIELQKMDSKPYAPIEGIKKVMELYDSHEMRKYTLEWFYDDSIVRDLDQSGYIDSLYPDGKSPR